MSGKINIFLKKSDPIMYKVQIPPKRNNISELSNSQLLFTYIYLKRTFKYLYHRKLSLLAKKEKKAIIYDLELFKQIKEKKYSLRCCTPQKWFEEWEVNKRILNELEKRKLSKKILEFN